MREDRKRSAVLADKNLVLSNRWYIFLEIYKYFTIYWKKKIIIINISCEYIDSYCTNILNGVNVVMKIVRDL